MRVTGPVRAWGKRGFCEWVRVKHQFGVSAEVAPRFLSAPKTVEITGVPFTFGQPMAGNDMGPELIREAGLRSVASSLGWQIMDHGDMELIRPGHDDPTGPIRNQYAVGAMNQQVADAVYAAADAGSFHLMLGGDHSIGAGALAGALRARPDCGILWVDAHADINTPEGSPSANAHGMPVAMNMSRLMDVQQLAGFEWLTQRLDPAQIVYVGLRDVDAHERRIIQDTGIKAFTMHDIDRHGIGTVMEYALDALKGRPVHMSYDIDAVDPEHAPSTGTVVRGGLTYREALYVAEVAALTGQLVSMDMVEVNPTLSDDKDARLTADLALKIVGAALGSQIL